MSSLIKCSFPSPALSYLKSYSHKVEDFSDFMLARAITPPLVTLVLHKGVPQLDVEDV